MSILFVAVLFGIGWGVLVVLHRQALGNQLHVRATIIMASMVVWVFAGIAVISAMAT